MEVPWLYSARNEHTEWVSLSRTSLGVSWRDVARRPISELESSIWHVKLFFLIIS